MSKRNISHYASRNSEYSKILNSLKEFLRYPFYLLLKHNIEVDGKTFNELAKITNSSRQNVEQLYKRALTVGLDKEGGVK